MAVNNPIAKGSGAWLGSATDCVAITPHATNAFTPTRGIMCTVAGNLACRFAGSSADVTLALSAGVVYPFSINIVRVTGTSATVYALY